MTNWEETDDGIPVQTEIKNGAETTSDADRVLVAVSREPVIDTLELNEIGLELGADGFLLTDDRAQTDLGHVFAVRDIAGEPMLAHKAIAEGKVAASENAALDYQATPLSCSPTLRSLRLG